MSPARGTTSLTERTAAALARARAALPAGEERPGQVSMAAVVAEAIEAERHLVVQAGTGTGKTLAYLVPAILSGRTVVVATATKALQDQLAGKDLPFLARALAEPFEFAVLKGRSNYLCRQRADEVSAGGDEQLSLGGLDDDAGPLAREVAALVDWAGTSPTGDRAELEFEPSVRAWSAVSVGTRECPGASRCPRGDDCFAEAARERAAAADVVVVNMHLYCTHLASEGAVLADHDLVVFDEAHELEDVAAATLGAEVGAGRLRALARAARSLAAGGEGDPAGDLGAAADALEAAMEPWRGRRLPAGGDHGLAAAFVSARERVTRLVSAVRAGEGDAPRKARVLQSGGHLVEDLDRLLEVPESHVAWVEGPADAAVAKVAPVVVADLLAARLWSKTPAVLTSATIPPNLRARLGIAPESCDEADVGSQFPYSEHALLYCATTLPDPRDPSYEAAMHEELEALVRAAGGRTLALFTSWRAMHAAAAALAPRLAWRVLTQADLPKPALVHAFSTDEQSCLFATLGFWQGIDVPGRALSLVTIDRLPFARPDDPVAQARREHAGRDAFRLVDLPRAATLLAQAAGRLIRSATDKGVVAVLDPRLGSASYRWDLVRALPPMRRTRHRAEVEAFLGRALAES